MHTAMWLSLQDELEKIAAHEEQEKIAFTLRELPVAGGVVGGAIGAAHGLAKPGKDAQGKQKSRVKAALKRGAIGAGIGAVGLPVGVIGALAAGEAIGKYASHAAELAGLGILGIPAARHLATGKEMSEKNKDRMEVAGLGVLAAPSALAVGKAGVGKLKILAKKMAKHAEVEKLALSPKTVQRASDKLGVSPSYLKELTQRAGSKRRYFKSVGRKDRVSIAGEAAHDYDSRHSRGHTSENVNQAREYTVRKLGRNIDKTVKRATLPKKKEAAPSMSAMMNMHRLADSAKAMKNVAKPAAAAVKLPGQAAQAARATSLAGHTAQGGHAWNAAAQAKRAIPL